MKTIALEELQDLAFVGVILRLAQECDVPLTAIHMMLVENIDW